MAEYRVIYKGGASYTFRNKKWEKGKPETITDERLVRELKARPGFTVTKLKSALRKPDEKKAKGEDKEKIERESDEETKEEESKPVRKIKKRRG